MVHRITQILVYCFFLITCCNIDLTAQVPSYNFTHISTEDGLAGDWVQTALLDQNGYMWFATLDGLSRYEGNNFKTFKSIDNDSTTLGGSTVMGIVEDQQGDIWVATMGVAGLNRYLPETETFERFPYPILSDSKGQTAYFLLQDPHDDHILWIGTLANGLLQFDKKTKTFSKIDIEEMLEAGRTVLANSILFVAQDLGDKDKLWGASHHGLYLFFKSTGTSKYIPFPSGMKGNFRKQIFSILPESENVIWVGTDGSGIAKYEIQEQKWSFFRPEDQAKTGGVFSNRISNIGIASDKEFWLCSDTDGLMLFNKKTKRFSFVQPDLLNPKSFITTEVTGVYTDKLQRHWFFNKLNGISLLDPQNQKFQFNYLPQELICKDEQVKQVFDFAYDEQEDKIYMVSGRCYGLFVYDENNGFTDYILLDNAIAKAYDLFLLNDSKNRLWIGGSGLYLFNKKTKKVEKKFVNTLLNDFQIMSLMESKDGHLWLGTLQNGLIKLNPETGEMRQYIQNEKFPIAPNAGKIVFDMQEDENGNIWIAAHLQDLYKFNPSTETFTHLPISNFETMALGQDDNGMIWVGSISSGILWLDPNQPIDQEMKSFTEKDGLVSDQISHIEKDSEGKMWISTRYGFSRYEAAENQFYNYDKEDGIREPYQNKFDSQKGFKASSNGKILIGDKHGFYISDVKKMSGRSNPPKVTIANFKVFDKIRSLNKKNNQLELINLKHDENFFSFDFSALDFVNPKKNQFTYILEGFNKDWVHLQNTTTANFTNVGAGKYTLKVKAANSDGVWTEKALELDIKISPPWWATIWAYLLYTILGVLALLTFYRIQINKKLASMETLRLKELNDLKTRLYTNITHEFRTPLTIINGMAGELETQAKGNTQKGLSMIKRNGNQLLSLVDQMLDLSKIESGRLQLNFIQGDIIKFIQYLTESFKTYSGTKNILLTSYSEIDEMMMDYDPERIQHIISNLLSNAIKFTNEKGKIILHLSEKNMEDNNANTQRMLQIKIKDDGIGISEKDLPYVFDRFYQVDASQTRRKGGTGIGLSLTKELVDLMGGTISVKSTLGNGTEFTLLFPATQNAKLKTSKEPEVALANIKPIDIGEQKLPTIESSPSSLHDDLPRLLVIEDNPDVFDYIKVCLNGRYEIFEAEDGQQGIDQAIEIIPDIIISDVMMPEKDGFEVTHFLKQDDRTSHIPIILLTGKVDDASRLEGLVKGADAYLAKPFNKEELIVRLEKLVELRQLLQQRYSNIIIEDVNTSVPSNDYKTEDAFVVKMKAIVEKRLDDPDFSVAQFCKDAGLSRTQLHRKLKALTDRSATDFIRSIRLYKAKNLLQTTEKNISEIAYEVGFQDPSYFTRSFTKEFKFLPSETRNRL